MNQEGRRLRGFEVNILTVVATERYSALEVRESPARYVVARSVEEIVS